jgi:hypothetical protein
VFIAPGKVGDKAMRSIEYDTVNDHYDQYVEKEILPEVAKRYNIRTDAYSHAIAGVVTGRLRQITALPAIRLQARHTACIMVLNTLSKALNRACPPVRFVNRPNPPQLRQNRPPVRFVIHPRPDPATPGALRFRLEIQALPRNECASGAAQS